LAIPTFSADSERSFSEAGATVSDRRSALDSDTVEKILFVHSNAWVQTVTSHMNMRFLSLLQLENFIANGCLLLMLIAYNRSMYKNRKQITKQNNIL